MAAVVIVSPFRASYFVGLVAEHIAEVCDRGGDFGHRRRRERTEREPGDGGRRFVASEPVEKSGDDGQRDADRRGVARIVVVADRQSDVIERGQRVTVFGFKSGQMASHVGLVGAVTAVLGDRQAPAQGLERADGIGVAVGDPVGEKRE